MKTTRPKTKKRTKAGRAASLRCDALVGRDFVWGIVTPENWLLRFSMRATRADVVRAYCDRTGSRPSTIKALGYRLRKITCTFFA